MSTDAVTAAPATSVDPMAFRVLTMRRGFILKIDTGMNLTRISALTAAQRDGITDSRTMRGALRDINGLCILMGIEAAWSKKYPTDKATPWRKDAEGYATR